MEYRSLFKRYKSQDPREVFAHFPYQGYAGESWETPFQKLIYMAKDEDWSFHRPEYQSQYFNQRYPILTNYLNYTFLRIQEENKFVFSEEGDKVSFNTGLQTPRGKDIFATFFKNHAAMHRNQPDWTFYAFVDSYSDKMEPFSPNPELATYITDVRDLVFDTDYNIEPNIEHFLFQNEDRLPEVLQGNIRLAENVINGAIQSFKSRIRRNYKIAIPHWYDGKIQLMLPLILTNDEGIADLALVVERNDNRKIYMGKTILTMDMAYINARLLTKPADDWLNP